MRGVATTHYRATVDLRRYPDLVTGAQRGAAGASVERLIAQTATGTVPVDIWIDEDELVRRVSQKLSLKTPGGPTVIEQRFEFYDFGTAVHIAVPAADEVTDVTDLAAPGTATQGP